VYNGGCDPDPSECHGGAIFVDDADVEIHDTVFKNNSPGVVSDGGAIYIKEGTLFIRDTTFDANSADDKSGWGGAIKSGCIGDEEACNSHIEIYSTIFQNNIAAKGGAIAVYGGNLSIYDSTFESNSAKLWIDKGLPSGGIFADGANVLLLQVAFSNNYPGHYSGSKFTLQCRPGFMRNLVTSNCNACPVGSYNKDPDAIACLTPDLFSYVSNNLAVSCPTKLNGGAICGYGRLTYLNGSWHDGLDLSSPSSATLVGGLTVEFGLTAFGHRDDFVLGTTSRFYSCPGGAGACTVDRSSGGVTCAPGSSGVLCAVCTDGYTRAGDGSCARCDSAASTTSLAFGLLLASVLLLAVAVAALETHPLARTRAACCPQLAASRDRLAAKLEAVRTKLKLTFVFYQVVVLLGSVFEIPYDRLPGYRDFCESLSVLKFDFDFLHFGCISFSYSFHTKLYAISAVALGLELGVVALMLLFYYVPSCLPATKVLVTKAAGWMLVGTYFLYPSASAVIFTTFNCDSIDGVRYLVADYDIICDSKEHVAAELWATFMIAVFAVGLPVLYMSLLVGARRTATLQGNAMLEFFSADYKGRFFFW
jgi:hypothetical protein